MIEVCEMAEFVNDDVVCKMRRQENELVVKIEIAVLRAAAPA